MPKKKIDNEELIEDALERFPSNSNASKVAPIREERTPKTIEVVETVNNEPRRVAKATMKKRNLAQSFARTFLGEEAKSVAGHVVYDVLMPAAKDTISEMVRTFVDMLLFGESRPSRKNDRSAGKTIISYDRLYRREEEPDIRRRRSPRDRFGLEDIYFTTPKEAVDTLAELCDQLEQYEWVTVKTYFDIIELSTNDWTTNKWGWNDLSDAKCIHTRDGYAITLPEPKEVR